MNGRFGLVKGYVEKGQLWEVEFRNGEVKHFREENLLVRDMDRRQQR